MSNRSKTKRRSLAVFDGHNDTLTNLHMVQRGGGRSFFEKGKRGHIDLPRAREGSLGGGFFAVCVPNKPVSPWPYSPIPKFLPEGWILPAADPIDQAYAADFTEGVLERLNAIIRESDGTMQLAVTTDEVEQALHDGVIAVVLHFEGAECITTDLGNLEAYYQRGLRSLGPVWSRHNVFGHGVPFKYPSGPDTGPGLTEAGQELIRACNRIGIMIDMAHMNEAGFWDVARLTDRPLVVTHAGANALGPTSRNLTDRQLDAIGESGGIVGITFNVGDLRSDGAYHRETSLSEIGRHMVYIAERIGVDHVAFGSDFDGCKVPDDLHDVTGIPAILANLRQRGFDENDLVKITHGNWLRVLRETWVE